jgi:hypothetical protein
MTICKVLNLRIVKETCVIDIILEGMRRFPKEESLQTTAFFALGSLVVLGNFIPLS